MTSARQEYKYIYNYTNIKIAIKISIRSYNITLTRGVDRGRVTYRSISCLRAAMMRWAIDPSQWEYFTALINCSTSLVSFTRSSVFCTMSRRKAPIFLAMKRCKGIRKKRKDRPATLATAPTSYDRMAITASTARGPCHRKCVNCKARLQIMIH
jgi:hypothetical protein